jgi:hypothetical protein
MSAIRILAILGAVAVSLALENGFGVPRYVSLLSGVAAYLVIRFAARAHQRLRRSDGLADRIADAVKGLPPEKAEAVGKRMIDEALK